MRTLFNFIAAVSVLPLLHADVIVRSVASSGMTIPERVDLVVNGIADVSVGEFGDVAYSVSSGNNNSSTGSAALLWGPELGSLYLLGTLDEPPLLPVPAPDFLNSQGNPFEEPRAGGIVNLPKFSSFLTLEVRYADFNVSGSKIAYIGISQYGSLFFRETGTTSRGMIEDTGELVTTGLLSDPLSIRIGRASAFGGEFETVFERGMELPDLEPGESLGFVGGATWNESGRFASLLSIEDSQSSSVGSGLFFEDRDREGVDLIARSGEPHPSYPGSGLDPNGVFENVGGFGPQPFSINDRGELAFSAVITDPDDGASTVFSIWHQEDGPEIRAIARMGTPTNIQGYGTATFIALSSALLTEGGDIVYRAQWIEGGDFLNGLIRWQQSDDTHHMVLKEGDSLLGEPVGLTVDFVTSFKMTPAGQVVAKIRVKLPGGGTQDAIIAQRASGLFHVILVIGSLLELSDGTPLGVVDVANFPPNTSSNGMDGLPYCFAPSGRFALKVTLQSGANHLLAVDVDSKRRLPRPERTATAGRTESWERPTGFDEGLNQEEESLNQKLATANDNNAVIDLPTLTGLTEKEVTTLRRNWRFSSDDRQFALEYLNARLNVLTSIRLAALWDLKRAAWLLDAFRGGRILFGSQGGPGIRAFAEIDSDDSAEGGTETITLRFLSKEKRELYQPDLVQLTNSLLHEARHAFQAFPGLNSIHTAQEQAEWAKGRHANELIASREELVLVGALLDAILHGGNSELGKALTDELDADLSGLERQKAEDDLVERLRKIQKNAELTEACRLGYCEALQRFLDAGSTSAAGSALTEELKLLKCFALYRKKKNEFGEIGIFNENVTYNASTQEIEPTTTIRQVDLQTGQETSFNVGNGAEAIFDAALSEDGENLYVAAKTGTTGSVLSYNYDEATESYDPLTEDVVFTREDMAEGVYLSVDPGGKGLHAYALESGTVYALDEVSALLEVVGQFGSSDDPVLDFSIEESLLITSPMPRFETPGAGHERWVLGYGTTTPGSETSYNQSDQVEVLPTFGKAPVEGDLVVLATGQPGAPVRVERATGAASFAAEASATFDSAGHASLTLSSALEANQTVQLGDNSGGSATMPVWPQVQISDEFLALAASDRGLYVEVEGEPGASGSIEWGTSLQSWGAPVPFTVGPFGTSVQNDTSLSDRPPRYFGRLSFPE